MSEAAATIAALSKDFDRAVIQMKPGSNKRPAMPYVSHGSVTKRLNAVCPGWSSRVMQVHTYHDQQGRMQCAGVTLELTIPGVGSREEFGAANTPRDFGTDAKNAMSDALKRCAMRFGVAIDLWEDMDEDNDPEAARFNADPPATTARQPRTAPHSSSAPQPAAAPTAAGTPTPLTEEQERVLVQVREMAEAKETYGATKALVQTLEIAATDAQWTEIRRRWFKVRQEFYPLTIKQVAEQAG